MALDSDKYPVRSQEPDLRIERVKFGGGAAAIVQITGKPILVSYVGTGLVNLTFPLANFEDIEGAVFSATTMAQVGGYTCNFGAFNTATKVLPVSIYKNNAGTPALVDLTATQFLSLLIATKGQA